MCRQLLVVADTELGKIGLSICYDLRFPEMYRALVDQGAELIAVLPAFTLTTGKDHWHTLLKARAIECQAWVLAPGQWGQHDAKGRAKATDIVLSSIPGDMLLLTRDMVRAFVMQI